MLILIPIKWALKGLGYIVLGAFCMQLLYTSVHTMAWLFGGPDFSGYQTALSVSPAQPMHPAPAPFRKAPPTQAVYYRTLPIQKY